MNTKKIAYLCDTGTGKHPDFFKDLDIFCLPLQITDENITYQDMLELDNNDCLNLLKQKKLLKTSLPSLGNIEDLFEHLKQEGYEQIYAIPICSGLSSTINALKLAANDCDIPLYYYDTYVTMVIEEYLIIKLKQWHSQAIAQDVIDQRINDIIESCNTLLIPTDMQHFKRGGRLSPAAALLAGLLKIYPILQINKKTAGKIDVLDKVRTYHKTLDKVIETMHNDNVDDNYLVTIAHVDNLEQAINIENLIKQEFPNTTTQIIELCNCVSIHAGIGCIGIQYFKQIV